MKESAEHKEETILSGLLKIVRKFFEEIPDQRSDPRGRYREISLVDILMSGLAMFGLKMSSLLEFDRGYNDPVIRHNLNTMYGIKLAPSDTRLREVLDNLDSIKIRGAFKLMFEEAQKKKLLDQYKFLNGYLLLIDGTEIFNSSKIECQSCCVRRDKKGQIKSHYHQMLGAVIAHPNCQQVIPLCPEMIHQQDGANKNDCEPRALQRFFSRLKEEHPDLKVTIVGDALFSNKNVVNEIMRDGQHFIMNVKPLSSKVLLKQIEELTLQRTHVTVGKDKYIFRYVNGVPLNGSKGAPLVNFLECKTAEITGTKKTEKTFTWVTNHEITKDRAYLIMRAARARWKIENETFNTLKNQGYAFDHNFGHGKKHLQAVFTLLMMLAFLIDQIEELACKLFQAAYKKMVTRRALWEKIRSLFCNFLLTSWEELFTAIAESHAGIFIKNSS